MDIKNVTCAQVKNSFCGLRMIAIHDWWGLKRQSGQQGVISENSTKKILITLSIL